MAGDLDTKHFLLVPVAALPRPYPILGVRPVHSRPTHLRLWSYTQTCMISHTYTLLRLPPHIYIHIDIYPPPARAAAPPLLSITLRAFRYTQLATKCTSLPSPPFRAHSWHLAPPLPPPGGFLKSKVGHLSPPAVLLLWHCMPTYTIFPSLPLVATDTP